MSSCLVLWTGQRYSQGRRRVAALPAIAGPSANGPLAVISSCCLGAPRPLPASPPLPLPLPRAGGTASDVGSGLTSLLGTMRRVLQVKKCTYSFFRLAGKVGTNFSFCVPCLVTSEGRFARLDIALEGLDGPALLSVEESCWNKYL